MIENDSEFYGFAGEIEKLTETLRVKIAEPLTNTPINDPGASFSGIWSIPPLFL
jgi:hypothetical protein